LSCWLTAKQSGCEWWQGPKFQQPVYISSHHSSIQQYRPSHHAVRHRHSFINLLCLIRYVGNVLSPTPNEPHPHQPGASSSEDNKADTTVSEYSTSYSERSSNSIYTNTWNEVIHGFITTSSVEFEVPSRPPSKRFLLRPRPEPFIRSSNKTRLLTFQTLAQNRFSGEEYLL
jgi:hypothetical protein